MMDLELGPIVGHTTDTESRIWIRHPERIDVSLRWARARVTDRTDVGVDEDAREMPFVPLPAFGVRVATVPGLTPDTRYVYEVLRTGTARTAREFPADAPSFFTMPPRVDDLRFLYLSCNGLHRRPPGRRATAMWARANEEVARDPQIRFAILGGDQVYADDMRDAWLDDGGAAKLAVVGHDEVVEELAAGYARVYRGFWHQPDIRRFMANVPCTMMWDDHDIYDGWGSHGDEHEPVPQAFFAAASRAFDAHQAVHNPSNGGATDHRAFAFRVGALGVLVLDLRSRRRVVTSTAYPLLGDEQWAFVQASLDRFAEAKITHLAVACSVPPVFAGRVLPTLPGWLLQAEHDDVLDQWSSGPNLNDQRRLFGKLFEFRREYGANVLLLGGDVHCASITRLRSRHPQFVFDDEPEGAVIHQLVSSGIAYQSPAGAPGWLLERFLGGEQEVSDALHLVADIQQIYRARNFAVVSPKEKMRGFWAHLHTEDSGVPIVHHFPGRPK
ncbi:MAG TPA: alkaline phosphatase D family protein [Nannocystaceae bacterium]|nr:alkaline phosphatase D family protein [Nannocystaceae bacterium]